MLFYAAHVTLPAEYFITTFQELSLPGFQKISCHNIPKFLVILCTLRSPTILGWGAGLSEHCATRTAISSTGI